MEFKDLVTIKIFLLYDQETNDFDERPDIIAAIYLILLVVIQTRIALKSKMKWDTIRNKWSFVSHSLLCSMHQGVQPFKITFRFKFRFGKFCFYWFISGSGSRNFNFKVQFSSIQFFFLLLLRHIIKM